MLEDGADKLPVTLAAGDSVCCVSLSGDFDIVPAVTVTKATKQNSRSLVTIMSHSISHGLISLPANSVPVIERLRLTLEQHLT